MFSHSDQKKKVDTNKQIIQNLRSVFKKNNDHHLLILDILPQVLSPKCQLCNGQEDFIALLFLCRTVVFSLQLVQLHPIYPKPFSLKSSYALWAPAPISAPHMVLEPISYNTEHYISSNLPMQTQEEKIMRGALSS